MIAASVYAQPTHLTQTTQLLSLTGTLALDFRSLLKSHRGLHSVSRVYKHDQEELSANSVLLDLTIFRAQSFPQVQGMIRLNQSRNARDCLVIQIFVLSTNSLSRVSKILIRKPFVFLSYAPRSLKIGLPFVW